MILFQFPLVSLHHAPPLRTTTSTGYTYSIYQNVTTVALLFCLSHTHVFYIKHLVTTVIRNKETEMKRNETNQIEWNRNKTIDAAFAFGFFLFTLVTSSQFCQIRLAVCIIKVD